MKGGPGSGGREVAMHVQVALKSFGTAQPKREGPGAHGGRSTIQRSKQMLITDYFGGGGGNSGGDKQNLNKPISSSSKKKKYQVSVRLVLVFSIDTDVDVGDFDYNEFRLYVEDLEVDPVPQQLRERLNNIIDPNSCPTLCSHINESTDIIGPQKRNQLINALRLAYHTNAVEIEDELEEL